MHIKYALRALSYANKKADVKIRQLFLHKNAKKMLLLSFTYFYDDSQNPLNLNPLKT